MSPEELKKHKSQKEVHYGNIWDCPKPGLLIVARMLDKTRRLVQLEYLKEVSADFGDIEEVKNRIGDINAIQEDTLTDLIHYIDLYRRGKKVTDTAKT